MDERQQSIQNVNIGRSENVSDEQSSDSEEDNIKEGMGRETQVCKIKVLKYILLFLCIMLSFVSALKLSQFVIDQNRTKYHPQSNIQHQSYLQHEFVRQDDSNKHNQDKAHDQQQLTQQQISNRLVIDYGDTQIVTKYPKPNVYNTIHKQQMQYKREMLQLGDIKEVQKHLQDMRKGQFKKNDVNYAYKLFKQPNNSQNIRAQYLYFDNKYNISQYGQQLPMCIIAAGRNMLRNKLYQQFLYSINRQNYTNYKLVVVDDQSDDGTFETFKTLIYSLNKLKHRTILIQNIKNVGSLGNKELMVRNYCEHDDIVIDLDADDSLVGSQVLQLLNTLYQSTNYWFIYSNNFFQRPSKSYHESGLCTDIPNKNWKNNSYRTQVNYWVTSQIRSYRRQVYAKIPSSYLLQDPQHYYVWASDRFIMYAIVQLSGKQHTKFIPQLVYYYNINKQRQQCFTIILKLDEYKARMQTPLLPLDSLQSQVKITKNYKIPKAVIKTNNERKAFYEDCKKKGLI